MKLRICLIALLILQSSLSFSGELEDRADIEKSAANLFIKEKFDQLSEMAARYLETEERTSSGLWKLTLFNAGIAGLPNQNNKDEKYWDSFENKALRWIESRPDCPSGYIAYSEIVVGRAYMYRGNSWAKNVKKENWKPFYANIAKAKQFLYEHQAIASKDPRWYECMLTIAKLESWEASSFESLLNEATSKFPYYYQMYFAAFEYFLPKWHGSSKAIETFAQQAVQKTKQKEADSMYARIYWNAYSYQYGSRLFKDSDISWAKMSKSIDDVLSRYPDQWNINHFALFAVLSGDKRKANALIKMIEGEPIFRVWKNRDTFEKCKAWASH
ncbi:hypothetical protein [uncultured Desulfobacter sp.]|uniref:hypothetical protein n=1 Tax=uncultured Desulfobacter sp. TaxID=240139 RepID=UPI0029F5B5D4|nr:hypothetical protein [uncultured Desulfobacter sp.]